NGANGAVVVNSGANVTSTGSLQINAALNSGGTSSLSNAATITAQGGSLAVSGNNNLLITGTGTLSATSNGTITLSPAADRDLNATQGSRGGPVPASATNITISAGGPLTIGDLTGPEDPGAGAITVTATSGALNIAPNAVIQTHNADINFSN